MARTAIPPSKPIGGYPQLPLAAGSAKKNKVLGDTVNNHSLVSTGRELLEVRNNGASAYTLTIYSAPDPDQRTGDITAYSIPAGESHIFGPFPEAGWRQLDGTIWVDVDPTSATNLELSAIILPVF